MKAGVAVQLKLAAELVEPRRRPHLDLVRPRGGLREPERAGASVAHPSRPARGRFRDPGRTDRGASSRAAATATCASRCGRSAGAPTRRGRGSGTTPSTIWRRSSRPSPPTRRARSRSTGWSTARASTRSASAGESPATSSPTRPWCTSTTGSPRAEPAREAVEHLRELFAGFDVTVVDLAEGARPGLDAPLAQAIRGRRRWRAASQVRLDGCRALRRPRHPGRELRPGRPDAGPRRRRARAAGADHRLRARPASLAEWLTPSCADAPAVRPTLRDRVRSRALVGEGAGGLRAVAGGHDGHPARVRVAAAGEPVDGRASRLLRVRPDLGRHLVPHRRGERLSVARCRSTRLGHVEQNAWAFLPAYPFLCGALAAITGLPFSVVGVFVSVGFAAGTALVFYRLLLPQLGASTALFSVVLFCVAPLSPIMQVDYAESMQLFFLACALLSLLRRNYWMMLPVRRLHVVHAADRPRVRARDGTARGVPDRGATARPVPAARGGRGRRRNGRERASGLRVAAHRGARHGRARRVHRHGARRGERRTSAGAGWCRSSRGSRAPTGG